MAVYWVGTVAREGSITKKKRNSNVPHFHQTIADYSLGGGGGEEGKTSCTT